MLGDEDVVSYHSYNMLENHPLNNSKRASDSKHKYNIMKNKQKSGADRENKSDKGYNNLISIHLRAAVVNYNE